MAINITGVVLHQYVKGNLIRVTKPETKIKVTIKKKRPCVETPRSTSEKKEETQNPANDLHTSSAFPLANKRSAAVVNRRK